FEVHFFGFSSKKPHKLPFLSRVFPKSTIIKPLYRAVFRALWKRHRNALKIDEFGIMVATVETPAERISRRKDPSGPV
ncbi:MAG: hypothetical protein ACKN97_07965, partial [Acidobacteriota bacterium]